MKQPITMLDISWRAIFKIFIVAILFYILYLIRGVLVWMFLALIISILINPWINSLEKRRIPRSVGAPLVYFLLLFVIALLIYAMTPSLISELEFLSKNLLIYINEVPEFLNKMGINSLQDIAALNLSLQDSLIKVSSNIINVFSVLFGSVFAGITVFSMALFMSIEEREIIRGIKMVAPKGFEEDAISRWQRSQDQVVAWFGSRVFCAIAVTIMTFILCVSLDIKLALSLSIISGVLNFIPIIGPIASAVLVMTFALMDSWTKLVIAGIFLILIQQIETNILTPILTKRMVGLPNVLVLSSILIGGILGGIVGALLAIPFAGIFFEATKEYLYRKKLNN